MIKETVQQAATAITAALELETEIVDEKMMIIGGTGRYRKKIGTYEENGDIEGDFFYAMCLRGNHEYICFEPDNDPCYDPKENEMAEICCPIQWEGEAIGLIGLIAFTESQKQLIISKANEFIVFLRSMADLISGKYAAELNNLNLQAKIESLFPNGYNTSFDRMIGTSPAMRLIKQRAMQISSSDSTVLITGESGTGKNLLAHAIHSESPRKDKPFIDINCAAIPESLLESELFGYTRGSFTGAEKNGKIGKFQLAEGGTIFLDEIGDMPIHLQSKILTALQNHQINPIGATAPIDIDVRVIAATNKNLEEMIANNRFREDLYFRLNVIPIYIPALRERPEDIELLLQYAIEKFSAKLNKPVRFIDDSARTVLMNYTYPGNVREIENIIEYAINMATSITIRIPDLPDRLTAVKTVGLSAGNKVKSFTGTLREQLIAAEQSIIIATLDNYGWSLKGKREAADALDISESTLYRKLRQTGSTKKR